MKLRKKQNTFPLQEQKLLQLTTTCRGKSLCTISWGRLCRGKPPEKAPGKLCSMKTREAELSRVEGSMAGAAEKEGKAGTQPGPLKPGKLQLWEPGPERGPACRGKAARGRGLAGCRGVAVFCEVRGCVVPDAMGRRGGQRPVFAAGPWFPCCHTKQGGYQQVFLLRRLVLTEASRGSLIWVNPPGLYCVWQRESFFVRKELGEERWSNREGGLLNISHLTLGARVQILQRVEKAEKKVTPSPAPTPFVLSFMFNGKNSVPGVGRTSSMGIPCV